MNLKSSLVGFPLDLCLTRTRHFSKDYFLSKYFLQLEKRFVTVLHNEELCFQDWFAEQISTSGFCTLDPNQEDNMCLLKHMKIRLFETEQISIYSAKLI